MDADTLYRAVGSRICYARDRAGISQGKLAKKLGMSRTSIVNIESGKQRPPLHVLWQIAEELGTEVSLLVPDQRQYSEEAEPVSLDRETVEEIERAANGDPVTRRDLTRFISKVKAKRKTIQ